jgi:hypothetical protein
MKNIFLTLILLILAAFKADHPMYVSVSEVDYLTKKQEIQVALKIFTDDLERAVKVSGKPLYLDTSKEVADADEHLQTYLKQHFKVKVQKKMLPMHYAGKEYLDGATWLYFSFSKTPKTKSIEIINDVVTEVYDEQKNLVHFRKDRTLLKSAYLSKSQTTMVVSW